MHSPLLVFGNGELQTEQTIPSRYQRAFSFTKKTLTAVRWARSTKAVKAHHLNAWLCISGSNLQVDGTVQIKVNNNTE